MSLEFEWDSIKSAANRRKHGVAFDEASSVFGDPLSVTIDDVGHSKVEDRFVIIGRSVGNRLLVVVYTEREDRLRLISARVATPQEARAYGQV